MLELILHSRRLPHKYWLRPLPIAACAVCMVGLLAMAEVNAHKLEDGFVERSVAVVVRPGEATISYSIGANEATRQQLANSWSAAKETTSATSQAPASQELAGRPLASQAVTEPTKPTKVDGDAPFLRAVGDALLRGITVEADENPVALELVEVIPTPRNHVEATVVMRVKLPNPQKGASSILLKFHDRNFPKCAPEPEKFDAVIEVLPPCSQHDAFAADGAFRYAMKGAGGVMLNRSTVAPILIRATRKLVAEIPADQLDVEQQFSAEIILP